MKHVGLGVPIRQFDDADLLIQHYLSYPEIVSMFVVYQVPPDVVVSLLRAFLSTITLNDTKDAHSTIKQMQLLFTPAEGQA